MNNDPGEEVLKMIMDTETTKTIKTIPCKYCSKVHPAGDRFCSQTGKKIPWIHAHKGTAFILGLAVVGFLILLIVYFYPGNPVPGADLNQNTFRPVINRSEYVLSVNTSDSKSDIRWMLDMVHSYLESGKVRNIKESPVLDGWLIHGNAAHNSGMVNVWLQTETPIPVAGKLKKEVNKTVIDRSEELYTEYRNSAFRCFESAEWDKALDYINKAKKLKNTLEINELERKIEDARLGKIDTVQLASLDKETKENFLTHINGIYIPFQPRNIKVNESKNQVAFFLLIDEKGKVIIEAWSYDNLEITPFEQKKIVIQKIRERLESIRFAPPRNISGVPIKIRTWKFVYEVKLDLGINLVLRRN